MNAGLFRLVVKTVLGGVAASAPAYAQEQAARPGASATDRVVYDEAYFGSYNVSTAEDMLRLLPGVPAILDATVQVQQRGFGSGGARVLIDGRRFPGKANEVTANLRRIPRSSVARVELISGTAEGISVQSEGLLVNIVLREGASLGGSGAWEANLRFNDEDRFDVDGLFAYNGVLGALSYKLGLERNMWSPPSTNRYSNRFRDEVFYYPDGRVLERRPQDWMRDHEKWIYTGGLTYDFAGGSRLQLNGLFQTLDINEIDQTRFERLAAGGEIIQTGLEYHDRANETRRILEIGSEYESSLGPGDLRGLFIVRRENIPTLDVRTRSSGGQVATLGSSQSAVDTGEDILRLTYSLPLAPDQTIEFGGEVAQNTLSQDLRVGANIVPTSEVKELRGEAFITYRWSPGSALSFEGTLNYERSRLTTNFPFIPERELGFVKPRFDLRYRTGPRSQFRLLLDRSISQLDFNNFVPRFDVSDPLNPALVAGNPQIVPDKTWTLEAGYEHRLPNDAGLIEARVFYKDISDTIDKIPLCRLADETPAPAEACIPAGVGRLYSAEGNIPNATQYGGEVKASVRLGFVRLPDALLSASYLLQKSEVEDPFARAASLLDASLAKEMRRLRNERGYALSVSFRHDLKQLGAAYGFTYQRYGWGTIISDLYAREYYWMGPTLDGFVEAKLAAKLTLRFEVVNVLDSEEKTRLLYAQNAVANGVTGSLSRYEKYREDRDTRFSVRLRGLF